MAGSTVTYRIRVRNRGTVALGGLAVADDLPAGMSLARIPSGSSLRGGRLVWTLELAGRRQEQDPLGLGADRPGRLRPPLQPRDGHPPRLDSGPGDGLHPHHLDAARHPAGGHRLM